MTMIAMCVYATAENKKFGVAKKCIKSLLETVDLAKHRLMIIDQNSILECKLWLSELAQTPGITIMHLNENIGTARGINLALQQRNPGEMCIKCDDDLEWTAPGWIEKMEAEIIKRPEIGILGLRRDDVYGEMIAEGNLLWCHDIFGTCTMLNPAMLDKAGYYYQPSLYGFDDVNMSVRSEAAGFRNAFMKKIRIINLDLKETPYTDWKRREAGLYLQEISISCDMIRKGELDYYYEDYD